MARRHELEYPSSGTGFSALGQEITSQGQEFPMPEEVSTGQLLRHGEEAAIEKKDAVPCGGISRRYRHRPAQQYPGRI